VDKRVLVVDDHTPTVDLISDALETEGFSVLSAGNGAECLMKVYRESPDVLILDVSMPVMDGLEALRSLREATETARLPVIVLSGRGEFDDVLTGWQLGANLYLVKPVKIGAVVAAVKWLLGAPVSQQAQQAISEAKIPGTPARNPRAVVACDW